jgi:hypothetical protein
MRPTNNVIEKAALALLEKAQDCFDLAETQQDNADKQHENAARQHASADKESDNAAKLVTLACALVDDAVNLQGETEVLPAPLHQRGPRSPPAPWAFLKIGRASVYRVLEAGPQQMPRARCSCQFGRASEAPTLRSCWRCYGGRHDGLVPAGFDRWHIPTKHGKIPPRWLQSGGDNMASAEEYERYAEHCLKMARMADNREDRIIQREIASEWLELAADLRRTKSSYTADDVGAHHDHGADKVQKRG